MQALAAQLHGCRALAYLAKGHEANRARAAGAGAFSIALQLLKLVEASLLSSGGSQVIMAEAVESACSVIAFVGAAPSASEEGGHADGGDGTSRVVLAVQAGCVEALMRLAKSALPPLASLPSLHPAQADGSSPTRRAAAGSSSTLGGGGGRWRGDHQEAVIRWSCVGLTALLQAAADAASSGSGAPASVLLQRALVGCNAREAFAVHAVRQWKRKKVREAAAECLRLIDASLSAAVSGDRLAAASAGGAVAGGSAVNSDYSDDAGGAGGGHCVISTAASSAAANAEPAARDTTISDSSSGSSSSVKITGYIYDFRPGLELEAAGRKVTKGFLTLRRDLAALPWLLASGGPNDLVAAPPLRPEFRASLLAAGVDNLPVRE
eukprot:COSAG06_NODE_1478_length_9328_cov_2.942681_6_plen_380_part_00